jgi:LmbE family N-acetylglucosaminyl deacetylase
MPAVLPPDQRRGEGLLRVRRDKGKVWRRCSAVLAAVILLALVPGAVDLGRAATGCSGSTLYTVAHQDDSILFQDPDLQHQIQSGLCVRTIFVTAGDAGLSSSYWLGRENGAEASYAQMAGVSNSWTQSDAGVQGHPMPVVTLTGNSRVSLVFMRLPDGKYSGGGFQAYGYESLRKLWDGSISTMHVVDGTSSYTRPDLTSTLTTLMTAFQPDQVRTMDYVGPFDDGDHSDHHAVAYFTQAASQQYTTAHSFTGYRDYGIQALPANLSDADSQAKQATWFTYAPYDPAACQTVAACQGDISSYWGRQYTVEPYTVASQPPAGSNVAPVAAVTASTETASTGQFAVKAVDGLTDGCCSGDPTHEWATLGEKAGAWLNLAWQAPQTLTSISLYDRPNSSDQITAFSLSFSDGSVIPVGALPNDGSPLTVTFASKTVSSVRLNITAVSSTTTNIGVAEIEARGTAAPPSAPTISSFSPISGPVGTSVTIDGSGFTGTSSVTFNGMSGTFSVGSDSQVTATVPSDATTGPVSITTGGGTATSATSFTVTVTAVAPTISSFSPTSGPVGTSVTINGSGFTGATSVNFNGVTAPFVLSSDSQITATVPSGATTGPVSVTTGGGTATSATSFAVTVTVVAPTISSFSPTSGPVGTSVTINGSGFSGASSVKFKNVAATFFSVGSDSQITATVPSGASTGKISVTTAGGTATSASSFTVTLAAGAPTISSFSPTSGPVGTRVTITGSGFTGASSVTCDSVAATFIVSSDTQITATVPNGAANGRITVTTPAGRAISSQNFRVTKR